MKRPAVFIGYDADPTSTYYGCGEMTFITSNGQSLVPWEMTGGEFYEVILPKLPSIEEAIAHAKNIEVYMQKPVYFFSRHEASLLMIEHLGREIDLQFRGTITNIRREEIAIQFDEIIDGEMTQYQIPRDSIVVAVAPLELQMAWLAAGVHRLLIPQVHRQVNLDGNVVFTYTGLKWIKSIVVEWECIAAGHPPARTLS